MNESSGEGGDEKSGKKSFTLPAINLLKGQPVIMGDSSYEPLKDKDDKIIGVGELIEKLAGSYDTAMVTDIDGIKRDRPQLELLKRISSNLEIWVDAGSRRGEGAIDILIAEAAKVVLPTRTLRNLGELENAAELSENIVLGMDYDKAIVSPDEDIRKMSPVDLAGEAVEMGIETMLFTDLEHLSTNSPFKKDVGGTLLDQGMDVYYHGRMLSGTSEFRNAEPAGVFVEVEHLL